MERSYQDAIAYFGIDGAHPGRLPLTKRLLKKEVIHEGTKILDAGCGTGQTSEYLAKVYRCQIYAVDKHPAMLQKAYDRFRLQNLPIQLFDANLENIPCKDNRLDIVLAESTIVFTNIPRTLLEFHRILKPGGVLLTVDMTAEDDLSLPDKDRIKRFYGVFGVLTEREWLQQFYSAGFKNVKIAGGNTVGEELEQQRITRGAGYSGVLQNHELFNIHYANQLGYRVFRAEKP
ncbi:class I SAM-dependent methyltransferase [Peribacillus sp. SCS-155]|uniref:class I SAM-dependent methyltransferase n=1 Tax=Peribacillus sedimenti TaxID=3115297 RepID=UPI0039059566